MTEHGHEQVVFVADPAVGLQAVIAIHSTALGPSLGGVRFWHYDTEADLVLDVLRLSEAMSLKAAMAGLHQGGGKAVVRWEDAHRPRSPELLAALGRAIHELGGRYLAAEDVGATTADMDGIAAVTPWVTGVSEADGGSGDPSPVTAVGVHGAMRASATAAPSLSNVTSRTGSSALREDSASCSMACLRVYSVAGGAGRTSLVPTVAANVQSTVRPTVGVEAALTWHIRRSATSPPARRSTCAPSGPRCSRSARR